MCMWMYGRMDVWKRAGITTNPTVFILLNFLATERGSARAERCLPTKGLGHNMQPTALRSASWGKRPMKEERCVCGRTSLRGSGGRLGRSEVVDPCPNAAAARDGHHLGIAQLVIQRRRARTHGLLAGP